MFLDDYAIEIIARSMNLNEEDIEAFKVNYFEVISNFIVTKVIGYMSEHDPEKAEKINKLFLSDKPETKSKAHKTLVDQMKLYMASYEDLQQEVNDVVKEYDNSMFFTFVGKGPQKEVLELLEYLSKKVDRIDNYQRAIEMAKKRFSKSEVDEFFGEEEG